MSNSHVEAQDLLHLELDGGFDFVNLLLHIFPRRKESGEFPSLGEARPQKTRDLLDHIVRGKEEVILLRKLLHELLVLVELLEVLNGHLRHLDTIGLFAVGGISKHAALDVGAGNFGQPKGAGETLVALRIVVLQRDLKLDGFGKITLLSLEFDRSLLDGLPGGEGENVVDGLVEDGGVQLVGHDFLGVCVLYKREKVYKYGVLFPSNDWSRYINISVGRRCKNEGDNERGERAVADG
jgi:hypothetical protein